MKVFVSYRRNDSLHGAARLFEVIRRNFGRDAVFLDFEKIPLGVNFAKYIRSEVSQCDVLIAVIGEKWLSISDINGVRRLEKEDDFVRIEIAAALDRDIPVIPVMLDGAKIPHSDELPEVIQELSLRNGLYIRGDSFKNDTKKLIVELKNISIKLSTRSNFDDLESKIVFAERLERCREIVDIRLSELISEVHLPTCSPKLLEAMRYSVMNGGKRLRPFLLMESARIFGIPFSHSVDYAAAVECIHCYSLVHDDLPALDDDDLRRGMPTVHVAFDEATAILAGDALATLPYEIILNKGDHYDLPVRVAVAVEVAKASGPLGLVGGQMEDLEITGMKPSDVTQDIIFRAVGRKNGLITSCCYIGALLGKASSLEADTLKKYGAALATAFQLHDDLLDAKVSTTPSSMNLVSILGEERAVESLRASIDQATQLLFQFGKKAAGLTSVATAFSKI